MSNPNRIEMIEILKVADDPGDTRRTIDAVQTAFMRKAQSTAPSGERGVEQTRLKHVPAEVEEPESQSFLMILLRALGAIHT